MDVFLELLGRYGLLIVFVAVLIELGGLPLPAYPIVVAASALAFEAAEPVWPILLVTASAAVIADVAWFCGGRYLGARMIRLMYGVTAMIRVAAGRMTTLGTFQACSPGGMMDTAGSTCEALVANSSTSPIPITNSGSAARASVVIERTWSVGLSRRTAMRTPRAIDSGTAMIADTSTRNAELASRALM